MSLASRERRDLERVARHYAETRGVLPRRNGKSALIAEYLDARRRCAHNPRWNAEERRYACAQCGRLLRAIELSAVMAGR